MSFSGSSTELKSFNKWSLMGGGLLLEVVIDRGWTVIFFSEIQLVVPSSEKRGLLGSKTRIKG